MKYIVFAGAVINIFFTFSYIKEVAKGSVKPNRITWLMWSVAPFIATAAAITNGVGLSVFPVFMSGFTPLLVFIVSFFNKNSYLKLERLDYCCGIVSFLALVVWQITKSPDYAIIFAIISDGLAAIPTVLKAWRYPHTENVIAFWGGLFLAMTSFFAITTWNFSSLAFPIYLVVLNTIIIFAIKRNNIYFKRT
mgnify:CR=1 FL=1